jgi:hypothetical protein
VGFEDIPGTIEPPVGTIPPTLEEINGQIGQDVPDNLLTPSGTYGGGEGGLRWPSPTATNPSYHLPVDPSDISGIVWNSTSGCRNFMPGGNGGGGAFALNGGNAVNIMPQVAFTNPFSVAPAALGGQASDFGLGIGSDPLSAPRKLDPDQGWLHGGAGGGGGGGNLGGPGGLSGTSEPLKSSFTNGKSITGGSFPPDCLLTTSGTSAEVAHYEQHSSAGGGGGGGAMQAQAGRVVDINGILDASGGSGGSRLGSFGSSAAGGGGAGGGALVQAPAVQIGTSAQRLNVSGGTGGTGYPTTSSKGGSGGAGLLRMETRSPLLTLDGELGKLAPTEAQLATVGAEPDDVYSFGMMPVQVSGPGRISGAQSCWMRPEGNFFVLSFLEDDGDELGWDMTIIPNPPSLGAQSYRGENDLFAASLEDVLGNELGASPLVIRFQGARIIKEVENFCDVPLDGEDAAIAQGSMTGWVSDPTELNTFFGDPSMRPNMFRFQILFDRSDPFIGAIGGIDGLTISVLPD